MTEECPSPTAKDIAEASRLAAELRVKMPLEIIVRRGGNRPDLHLKADPEIPGSFHAYTEPTPAFSEDGDPQLVR